MPNCFYYYIARESGESSFFISDFSLKLLDPLLNNIFIPILHIKKLTQNLHKLFLKNFNKNYY